MTAGSSGRDGIQVISRVAQILRAACDETLGGARIESTHAPAGQS